MDTFDFASWSQACLLRVEQALSDGVGVGAPAGLGEAMRYAVLDGGKRLRPLLVLAARQAVAAGDGEASASAGFDEAALRAACAVELIHAYSLVHDDLPAMDDDALRRGKPTTHIAFDEATAILAGDALQALAFELLAHADVDPGIAVGWLRSLSAAAGAAGMCGGQALDIAATGTGQDQAGLERMHGLKTGALIRSAVHMGALAGSDDAATLDGLDRFAELLGLAFQVRDDILDIEADSATLGKTAGKDQAQDKSTYPALLGLDGARQYLVQLETQMLHCLQAHGDNADALRALARLAVHRRH